MKGSQPAALEPRDDAAHEHGDVGDAAAADRYGDAGAGSERGEQRLGARPLVLERRERVDGRQDVEVLPHFEHGRQVGLVADDRRHHERICHPDLQTALRRSSLPRSACGVRGRPARAQSARPVGRLPPAGV